MSFSFARYHLLILLLAGAVSLTGMASAAMITRANDGGITMPASVQVLSPSIQRIRGTDASKLLAQTVTVEGYYYDGSIPMVIDDIDRVKLNLPLPDESFVPVVGAIPANLQSGDRVSISGKLFHPTIADPISIRGERTAVRISDATTVKVLQPSRLSRLPMHITKIPGLKPIWPHRYAVLIAGCINPSNNHARYWNELVYMYNILIGRGYNPANIYVFYADGHPRTGAAPSPFSVIYAATQANISGIFDQLAAKVTALDDVFIFTDDHGGGLATAPIDASHPAGLYGGVVVPGGGDATDEKYSEAALNMDINGDGQKNATVAVDQVLCLWGENMRDDDFAAQVNKINRVKTIAVVMEQCFSGGFIGDLRGSNRILMSAATSDQCSWAYHANYDYNEFSFWFLAALSGQKPDGSGVVDADSNHDGKISILEAYSFARAHDAVAETPWYDGDGIAPAHSYPNNTEAGLGINYVL